MSVGSTGYAHDGNRWYDPATSAFTTEDANSYLASPADGNRYAYAAGNPANYTDPTGANPACDIAGLVFGIDATILLGLIELPTGLSILAGVEAMS
jgi:RHS repeat-associated protein